MQLPSLDTPISNLIKLRDEQVRKITQLYDVIISFNDKQKTLSLLIQAINNNKSIYLNEKYFTLPHLIKYIDSLYWHQLIAMGGLSKIMTKDEYTAIYEQIDKLDIVDFTIENIKPTVNGWLLQLDMLYARKIDAIFRMLSPTHLTNNPSGFYKRFIIDMTYYKYTSKLDELLDAILLISKNNLVCNANSYRLTYMLDIMPCDGQWRWMLGNLFKVRKYLKGTVHIELHPDMAYQFNIALSKLYPDAIPSQFRNKDIINKSKFPKLVDFYLQPDTLTRLMSINSLLTQNGEYIISIYSVTPELKMVLNSIGGVNKTKCDFTFNYNPIDVIREISLYGCLPDYKSYQYYPTPIPLSEIMLDNLDLKPEHAVLEPSAGVGNLIKNIENKDRVDCVEISKLRCSILTTLGFNNVHNVDFLDYVTDKKYDRVIMNPPFTKNQDTLHILRAYEMLKDDGVMVCILPLSTNTYFGKHKVIGEYKNMFTNASVTVKIVKFWK